MIERLTPRQAQIARCIARGQFQKEIARDLGISHATVHAHLCNRGGIFDRLGARRSLDVARVVWREEEPA